MIAYPAVDLRGGRAVQLVGGIPGSERVRLDNPESVAAHWVATGFSALHVVDLDAALGTGDNRALITRILARPGVRCRVGGGIRDEQAIRSAIRDGAEAVIIGTRAVEDPKWIEAAAGTWPDRVIVAADVRDGRVLTRGWTETTADDVADLLDAMAPLPLAGMLITDVSREGRMQGVNTEWFGNIAARAPHPVTAAGGIASLDDLHRLEDAGLAGAVLGMALYTGALDSRTVAQEFGS